MLRFCTVNYDDVNDGSVVDDDDDDDQQHVATSGEARHICGQHALTTQCQAFTDAPPHRPPTADRRASVRCHVTCVCVCVCVSFFSPT